nr:hypothetical protein [Tanacetum cinerariifolium]
EILKPVHPKPLVHDSEEMTALSEVSRPTMSKKPGHVQPINHDKLNALFVPQKELSREQNNNKDTLVDGKEHDDDIQKYVSPNIHSSSSGAQTRKQGDKTENKDKGKSLVVTIIGFRDLNAEFEECTNNSSNGVNAASSSVSTAGHNFI